MPKHKSQLAKLADEMNLERGDLFHVWDTCCERHKCIIVRMHHYNRDQLIDTDGRHWDNWQFIGLSWDPWCNDIYRRHDAPPAAFERE